MINSLSLRKWPTAPISIQAKRQMRKRINFLLWVHSLPENLRKPLPPERLYPEETSDLYQFVIDSRLLWPVWLVDEFGKLWISVHRMGARRQPELHTLGIDDGTFEQVECDPYDVECEENQSDNEGQDRNT